MAYLIAAYYMMFIIIISTAPNIVAWKQVSAQLVVTGICAGTLWVFNWLIISPYRILQRTKTLASKN